MTLGFTGERIVPGAPDCEPNFAQKMYQEHVARYAFAAQLAAGADVLDVGCGVGYGSQLLAKAGATSVLGLDIADDAIEHARKYYFHPAASFAVHDAALISFAGSHDLVTCFELIEHVEAQEQVLDRIKAALRPAGVLAISTPRPLDDIRTHFHVHEMSFEELHGMLKQRFRHVEAFFEVNCFSSFVGRALPERLDRIIPVTDRIRMEHADYFVFLASDEPIAGHLPVEPVLTINDDRYVLTLEHDVDVLRRAETDHKERIADQEREKQQLAGALAAAEDRNAMFAALRDENAGIRTSVDAVRAALVQSAADARLPELLHEHTATLLDALERAAARPAEPLGADTLLAYLARLDETAELRRVLMDTQARLASIQSEAHAALSARSLEIEALARQRDEREGTMRQQSAELDTVRRAIAETSHRLAEAETRANALADEAGRLPEALAKVSALENEVNAMRYRLDHAERTLARFRGSLSWALTRPVRWVGRTFKKMTGRSLPQ
ncbi:MAG: methyltransferase domain-containing protein [Beijerinckiaceae bacterium]|jgi:2-polyprenyl-3-methyl-5-hydroxy-6-metoxy-1,4-benzoquinol methylase|nr:methyltransferase domain-containing protein [Beijerinckiaceae bacterium]